MKRYLAASIAVSVLLCLTSCRKVEQYASVDFFTMNTYAFVMAEGADDALLRDVKENVLSLEKRYSRTYEDSELNALASGVRPKSDTAELLNTLLRISDDTHGAFDFTLGTLCELWDVNGENPHVPNDNDIEEALSHCGYGKVRIDEDGVYYCDDPETVLDLGAAVKGYAGQRQIDTLKKEGIENAVVNLGGNVSVIGSSAENKDKGVVGWNVGINNPFLTSELLGTLTFTDATVSVSGSYERYFEENGVRYHHILDSITGYPADSGLVSVAVVCDDGLYADALSTALFVLGYDAGMALYDENLYDFEAIFCLDNGSVYITDGLKGVFEPNQNAAFSDNEKIRFEFIPH